MLLGAGFAKAGADAVEMLVRVTGVDDELPDRVGLIPWKGGKQGAEGCGDVGGASSEDADGSLGGGEAGNADEAMKGGPMQAECSDGEAAQGRGAGSGASSPAGLKGIADGSDLAGAGGAEERAQDARKKMGVLVGVDVRDAEAGGLEAADLRGSFGLDFSVANAAAVEIGGEAAETGTERMAVGAEGGDLLRG